LQLRRELWQRRLAGSPERATVTNRGNLDDPAQSTECAIAVDYTGDFAARDEHIRCVSYGVMRKLAGLPQDL
jgi:hypothetical protein